MGFLGFGEREMVCPLCRSKGAKGTSKKIRCRNSTCQYYDEKMAMEPFTPKPSGPITIKERSGKAKTTTFDPGENRVEIKYKNFRGDEKSYVGDASTIRWKGDYMSILLVPLGKRVTFKKQFIQNLADLEDQHPEPVLPTSRERQVLSYHKKHGTTSPLYEKIRQKYPE